MTSTAFQDERARTRGTRKSIGLSEQAPVDDRHLEVVECLALDLHRAVEHVIAHVEPADPHLDLRVLQQSAVDLRCRLTVIDYHVHGASSDISLASCG